MGIKDFLKIEVNGKKFEEFTELVNGDFIAGQKIAVDAYNVIYSSMFAMSDPLTSSGKITTHIKIVFEKIKSLNKLGVIQLWIFDSALNPLKIETVQKRKIRLGKTDVADIKRLLTLCGIKWMSVNVEAEFYAAALSRIGFVDAVLSSDMDVVVRGGNLLREKIINGKKYFQYINAATFAEKSGLTLEDLARVAVHIGCDFAPKTPRVGPKKVVAHRSQPLTERQEQALALMLGPIDMRTAIVESPETAVDEENLKKWLTELGFTKIDYIRPVYA